MNIDIGKTTAAEDYVHAWSVEKAVEYLRNFRQICSK